MNILGVIAEFNPFHNGHKYLLDTAKKQCQADYTIVVMSGNFTQRGEPAIYDKFVRTRWALMCGADLVIELPVISATASAGDFALGGVAQLLSTGVVTHLAFGCENPDLDRLMHIAKILSREPEGYQKQLKDGLKNGLSWPDARSRALCSYTAHADAGKPSDPGFASGSATKPQVHPNTDKPPVPDMLRQSNNILALEYLTALKKLDAAITPVPVARIHAGYHDTTLDTPICSATALRLAITGKTDPKDYLCHFPREIADHVKNICLHTPPMDAGDFSSMLAYRLHCLTGLAGGLCGDIKLTDISDVDKFLADRITNQLNEFTGFLQFADHLKHRSYTRTRISRALLHTLLNITREDSQAFTDLNGCGYLRILGFRKTAAPLLSKIKSQALVPMITRPQHYRKLLDNDRARRLFALDVSASDIYRLAWNIKAGQTAEHEFRQKLILF